MHTGSRFLACLLAAACVALAGCGGTALLKEARPVESSKPLAEAKDERIVASIDSVILRDGAGSWARNAEWDEYLVQIRAPSGEPVEIREIAIFDAFDQRVESRSERSDLVDGTREIERRYEQSGKLVRAPGINGWVAAGAGVAGAAAVAGSMAAASATAFAGVAAAAAAVTVLAGAGAVLAGVGVVRLVNNAEVSSEIKRRQTTLPVALQSGAEAKIDLFFPRTPLSGRAQVVYADRHGEHRLDIDTRQALLDLDPPPPVLVSRVDPEFPHAARRAGFRHGYVRALLTLDSQGRVQDVEVIRSAPQGFFDQEARRTLQMWTYSAGRSDGRTVETVLEFKR